MAAPSFVGVGSGVGGTGNIVVGLPSAWAQDDILILAVETADEAVSAPDGWTDLDGSPSRNILATRLTVFRKRAGASEDPVTVTFTGDHVFGVMYAVRYCPTDGNPVNASGADANDDLGLLILPSITTTVTDTLVVMMIARSSGNDRPWFSLWTNLTLTDVTERFDDGTAEGNSGGIGIATGVMATAGDTGETTIVPYWNSSYAWMIVALTYEPEMTASVTPLVVTLTLPDVMPSWSVQDELVLGVTIAPTKALGVEIAQTAEVEVRL